MDVQIPPLKYWLKISDSYVETSKNVAIAYIVSEFVSGFLNTALNLN